MEVNGIKAAKRHTLNNRKNLDDNLKYLHKIIQFCEDKQIQLILVTTPTWHSYYEHLDKHQLDQLLSTAKELDNNHENVFYFNFLKMTDSMITISKTVIIYQKKVLKSLLKY